MDAIKKQASKLREQVAKQQQAVRKQFTGRFGTDIGGADEADFQCHQKLRMLYSSTRAAKHLQRDIVRGVDNLIYVGTKQMEISTKLADDCCKYGNENENSAIAKASFHFGNSHKLMENERENLLKVLGEQVFEPLRAVIFSAPLEDARHLTYRYERVRRDVESQAVDVMRRHVKSREANANSESMVKFQNAEAKLSELRSSMVALGREATSAMESVESHQQEITFEKLLSMVEAERLYHQNATSILDKLHTEMIQEKQQARLISKPKTDVADKAQAENKTTSLHGSHDSLTNSHKTVHFIAENKTTSLHGSHDSLTNSHEAVHFIAEVIHSFDAQADGELSLSVGEYVVVRKVSESGWSEGECKGKAGWFPSAYVLECDKAPANKLLQATP